MLVAEEDSEALRQPENQATLEQVTRFVERCEPGADAEQTCRWIDAGGGEAGRRFWTLDPIDGTKGFLRGDQYAVALALVVDGQVEVGALGCPNLSEGYHPNLGGPGCLIAARCGQGAWTQTLDGNGDWQRLAVSAQGEAGQARLLRSFESGHTNVDQVGAFAAALGGQAEPVRMDSQAKYAVLAAGEGELYLRLLSAEQPDYREKIWDQAAGALILEEAGGQISDLDGKALDFTSGRSLKHNRGILASNGRLHEAALQALRLIGA